MDTAPLTHLMYLWQSKFIIGFQPLKLLVKHCRVHKLANDRKTIGHNFFLLVSYFFVLDGNRETCSHRQRRVVGTL